MLKRKECSEPGRCSRFHGLLESRQHPSRDDDRVRVGCTDRPARYGEDGLGLGSVRVKLPPAKTQRVRAMTDNVEKRPHFLFRGSSSSLRCNPSLAALLTEQGCAGNEVDRLDATTAQAGVT